MKTVLWQLALLLLVWLVVAPSPSAGFYANGRWASTATNATTGFEGASATLTWSIVPDGTTIPSLVNGQSRPSDLRGKLDSWVGLGTGDPTTAPWFSLLEQSVNRWAELSGLRIVYEPNDDGSTVGQNAGVLGVRGDIRLAGATIDGNGGALAQTGFIPSADIVFDTGDVLRYSNAASNYFNFRHTLMHEFGHSLGLGHNEVLNNPVLMAPFASTTFEGPQFDDIRGIQSLYGDRYEKEVPGGNGGPTTATDLGPLSSGGLRLIGTSVPTTAAPISLATSDFVSIANSSDADWFRFSVSSSTSLSVSVSPRGRTYSERAFVGQPFTSINTQQQSDLALQLYRLTGVAAELLASSNSGGLGQSESISQFALSSAGDYAVRVVGSTDEVQFYSLSIERGLGLAGDYNDDGAIDASDFTTWRDAWGLVGGNLPNAPDSPGLVDQADYELWLRNFGESVASIRVFAVAEPPSGPTISFLVVLAVSVLARKRPKE